MSCGDCDWGCVMPGCGTKMMYCEKHYLRLVARVEKLQAGLVAIDELVAEAEDARSMHDGVRLYVKELLAGSQQACEVPEKK